MAGIDLRDLGVRHLVLGQSLFPRQKRGYVGDREREVVQFHPVLVEGPGNRVLMVGQHDRQPAPRSGTKAKPGASSIRSNPRTSNPEPPGRVAVTDAQRDVGQAEQCGCHRVPSRPVRAASSDIPCARHGTG